MILRDYQERDIAAIRALFIQGKRRVCYAGATGSGKTILFVNAARKAVQQGLSVRIIVHRQELVDQTCEALTAEEIEYGIIAAGYPENPGALVQVAMVQTLSRRPERLQGTKFLVIDECHHILASTWFALAAAVPEARILGVTATPERLDGKGLSAAFDALVIGPSVKQLIAEGWLSPFVVFAPERMVNLKGARTMAGDFVLGDLAKRMNTEGVLADAVAEYKQHLAGKTAIAFCTTVEHSQATAKFFCDNGIEARHLDGDTPAAERRLLLERLATGAVKIISNCSLISEGLDIPSVGGVILLRPTKSLTVYLQAVGRALRPAPGKRAVILDHAGNTFHHGMPDLEHAWSLDGRPKTKGEALVRRCPECGALIPISARQCQECGADLRPQIKPAKKPEPLVELDPINAFAHWLAHAPFNSVTRWAGNDANRLRQIAQARGYKPGWVYWRMKAAQEASERFPR